MRIRVLRSLLLILACTGLHPCVAAAEKPPKNNPYTSRYKQKDHWTKEVRWKQVTDAAGVPGLLGPDQAVDSLVLHRTLAGIAANGGGVLYFPAGTYTFGFHVQLPGGVVLRGAEPAGDGDARNAGYAPPTRFEFPRYRPVFTGKGTPNGSAFKCIMAGPGAGRNFGLVNLDINRAVIAFDPSVPATPRPDSTAAGHGNVIIMGVRQNNAAVPDPGIPTRGQFDDKHGWQRWPALSTGNINVSVQRNLAIVNNRLNDNVTDDFAQPDYLTDDGYLFEGERVMFSYRSHYGIRVSVAAGGPAGELQVAGNYIRVERNEKAIWGGVALQTANNAVELETPPPPLVHEGRTAYANQWQPFADNPQPFSQELYHYLPGDSLNYRFMKPAATQPGQKYPLVLFFHEAGAAGSDNRRQLAHFITLFASEANRQAYPCFVLAPQHPDSTSFTTWSRNNVPSWRVQASVKLVDSLARIYPIDPDRLYVTGLISGANSAIDAMIRFPGRFGAAVLMSPYWTLDKEQSKLLSDVPIWVTWGAQDRFIPPISNRVFLSALRSGGGAPRFTEFPKTGINSWAPLIQQEETLLPWLFTQKRKNKSLTHAGQ